MRLGRWTIHVVSLILWGAALSAAPALPKGVADLFVACPKLAVTDEGYLLFAEKAGFPQSPRQENFKSDLLEEPEVYAAGTKVLVDEPNGYLSVVGPEDLYELALVYYKRPNGALIPALRFSSNTVQFPVVSWGFYDIAPDGNWLRIPDADILPKDPASAFFPSKPSQYDCDLLGLGSWGIILPRHGTTAHLMLQPYKSDLDDPRRSIEIPGTPRTVTQSDYYAWFQRYFSAGNDARALELRWVKANSRFEAGAVVAWREGSD
jgi:hypothetical protein